MANWKSWTMLKLDGAYEIFNSLILSISSVILKQVISTSHRFQKNSFVKVSINENAPFNSKYLYRVKSVQKYWMKQPLISVMFDKYADRHTQRHTQNMCNYEFNSKSNWVTLFRYWLCTKTNIKNNIKKFKRLKFYIFLFFEIFVFQWLSHRLFSYF